MKLEIIQPFINAADAVLGHILRCSTRMDELSMGTDDFDRRGIAAVVRLQGDIEGTIVLDVAAETARGMALEFVGSGGDIVKIVQDIVCELANQVIGNAVTVLNDCGYRFRVQPPEVSSTDKVPKSTSTTEALVLKFKTASGPVFLNIALRAEKAYAAD